MPDAKTDLPRLLQVLFPQSNFRSVKSAWRDAWLFAFLARLARRLKEPNSDSAWGAPAKFLHWLVAVLIFIQFALGWLAVSWRISPTKLDPFVWHKSMGMLILLLVLIRLVWRLLNLTPTLPQEMPAWERGAARLSHGLLYVLMITMPLAGWIAQSAAGIPFRVFWRVPLPAPVAPDKHLAALAAVLLGLLLACGVLQMAHAANWQMDSAGSRLEFKATYEMTPAPGVSKEFDVQMRFDPQKPADSRLDVSIRVASASLASADINKAIAGIEWFDFAGHPQAEFHSADIHEVQSTAPARSYMARGTLGLKGMRQVIDVPFSWSQAADGATMDGEFTVKRGVFGIGTGEWAAPDVIGPEVIVRFHVRLRQVP